MNFRLFLEMHDIHALLRAAFDRPDDDTPKLVAADWLDDHRFIHVAALIRYGVEYARDHKTPGSYIDFDAAAREELKAYNLYPNNKARLIQVRGDDGTPLASYVLYPNGLGYFNHAKNPGDEKPPRRIRIESVSDPVIAAVFFMLGSKMAQVTPAINSAEADVRAFFRDFLILGGHTNDTSASLFRFLKVADALLKAVRRWDGQSQTDYAAHQMAEQLLWQVEYTNGQVASQDNVPANDALLAKINRIGREIVSELQRISKAAEARWRAAYPNA